MSNNQKPKNATDNVLDNNPKTEGSQSDDSEVTSINKDVLNSILAKMEELLETSKTQKEQIDMLKNVADKARMSRYEDNNKSNNLIRTARVGLWDGFPIIGWSRVKDEVGFRDSRLQVSQVIKLFIDEGGKEPRTEDVDYLYWAQNTKTKEGEVIAKYNDSKGEVWSVQFPDGSKVDIDIRFINPF